MAIGQTQPSDTQFYSLDHDLEQNKHSESRYVMVEERSGGRKKVTLLGHAENDSYKANLTINFTAKPSKVNSGLRFGRAHQNGNRESMLCHNSGRVMLFLSSAVFGARITLEGTPMTPEIVARAGLDKLL